MITAEQRETRKKYIGSSDAAAVLGLDPYRSAADVWLEKTGRAAGFDGNANTERGNLLEPVVLAWAEKEIGVGLIRDQLCIHEGGLLCANLDAIVSHKNPSEIVEAKTTVNADEWGEPGTDQIPERVIVQVHHAMYVSGYSLAWVPVLIPGYRSFDFRMYRVPRDNDLAEAIAERCSAFMRDHVLPAIQPDEFKPSLDVLKRVRRTPKKTVPVSAELVDALVVARAAKKQAEDDCKAAEAELIAALSDAEAGDYGKGVVTYLETKRKGYTVVDSAFRQLRVKPAKGS